MAGGLIQIVTYGAQDIFLTGTPEITYFKVVYRRHTHFAMENIEVEFDDPVTFGQTSMLTVPRIGDLIHKAYLEIDLPQIDFKRDDANDDGFLDFDEARNNYEIVRAFMSINRRAYVDGFEIYVAENSNNPLNIVQAIDNVFNNVANETTIAEFRQLLIDNTDRPFSYDEVSMQVVVDVLPDDDPEDVYFAAMNVALDKSIKTQKFFYDDLLAKEDAYDDGRDENLQFAWVDRVGHAIVDQIEVFIGGQKIDRHWGDWLNIWYELSANRDKEDLYFKLIGNVPKLTTFDRTVKPKYRLRIPLQFWFCRHSGSALPLISLEYHQVTFHVDFRKLEEVSYIESGKQIFVSETSDSLFLDEVVRELGVNIDAWISFDFIYLDKSERRRFAQASHEYLVEQLQLLEIPDINQSLLSIDLNNFVHPSKELVWVAQKESYRFNTDGYTRTQWDNYSTTDGNKGNPIAFSELSFHSYVRSPRLSSNYYNYLVPWERHHTTPSDGINVYAFALSPEESQPTGSANLSRMSKVTLTLEFQEDLFPDTPLNIRIYSFNTNIIRFVSGMAGLAFLYG